MNIFKRLGLPETASAEEINGAIRKFYGANFTARLPTELITAYGQREREAGKRGVWEKICPCCMWRCDVMGYEHNPPQYCQGGPDTDGLLATFENCPLMKGEGIG